MSPMGNSLGVCHDRSKKSVMTARMPAVAVRGVAALSLALVTAAAAPAQTPPAQTPIADQAPSGTPAPSGTDFAIAHFSAHYLADWKSINVGTSDLELKPDTEPGHYLYTGTTRAR